MRVVWANLGVHLPALLRDVGVTNDMGVILVLFSCDVRVTFDVGVKFAIFLVLSHTLCGVGTTNGDLNVTWVELFPLALFAKLLRMSSSRVL